MATHSTVVLDAPSNLGLRPPETGAVPGVYKLAGALRDAGLLHRLGARDGGVVTPPRYRSAWQPGDGARNAEAIASYSPRLADRIGRHLDDGACVVVLGGDCSIVLGATLALRRRGRFGLAYLDGHSDYRHPDNAPAIGAVGGEALAVVTGRGDSRLVDLEGRGPYVLREDVAALGMRPEDEHLAELSAGGVSCWTSTQISEMGAAEVSETVMEHLGNPRLDGFWIHLDVDILDPLVMPSVDSPDPDGLRYDELKDLLVPLLAHDSVVGLDVCIFDPDLDPDGAHARRLTDHLSSCFSR